MPVYVLQERTDMKETKEKDSSDRLNAEVSPSKKKRGISKPIHLMLEGEFLSREGVVRNLPYLAFLTVIAILYIANTYYAEKTFKEIERTKNELKELRFQYITTKSALMYQSKLSEVVARAGSLGLVETMVPPYKIFYSSVTVPSGKKE